MKVVPKKDKNGRIIFKDAPNFTPNLTPREMFQLGSFGGTYWRPIYSSVVKKSLKDQHKKYPVSWWKGIPEDWLITEWSKYDKNINKYGVKVGTTLDYWECKKWITESNPYGWVQWYCDFYNGKRGPDDERQIKRWLQTAGPNSRFRIRLMKMIINKNSKYDDFEISPKIRQTLQHWGYQLTRDDFETFKKKET